MKIRVLLTENVKEVARKLQIKFPDKFKWDELATKIGEFSASPIESGQLLTWVAKQLLDDTAHVEYHGDMTKEMQLLEAARLFTQNKQFLKNKDISSYKNQPEVLAAVREGMNSPAALRAREKRNSSPSAPNALMSDKDKEYVYNGKTLKAIFLKSEEGSCKYGAGTKWCTAARENNLFGSYDSHSYLVVLIGNNRKVQIALKRSAPVIAQHSMDEQDRPIYFKEMQEIFGEELPKAMEAIRARFKWDVKFPWEPDAAGPYDEETIAKIVNESVLEVFELVSGWNSLVAKTIENYEKSLKFDVTKSWQFVGAAKIEKTNDLLFPPPIKNLSEELGIDITNEKNRNLLLGKYITKPLKDIIFNVRIAPKFNIVLPNTFVKNEKVFKAFAEIIVAEQLANSNSVIRKAQEAFSNVLHTDPNRYYDDFDGLVIQANTGLRILAEYDFRVGSPQSLEEGSIKFEKAFSNFQNILATYAEAFKKIPQIDLSGLGKEPLRNFILGPRLHREVGQPFFDRAAGQIGKINAAGRLLGCLFGEINWPEIIGQDGRVSRFSQDEPYRRKMRVLHALSVWVEEGLKNGATIEDFMTEARKLLAAAGAIFEDATQVTPIMEHLLKRFTEEEIRRILHG